MNSRPHGWPPVLLLSTSSFLHCAHTHTHTQMLMLVVWGGGIQQAWQPGCFQEGSALWCRFPSRAWPALCRVSSVTTGLLRPGFSGQTSTVTAVALPPLEDRAPCGRAAHRCQCVFLQIYQSRTSQHARSPRVRNDSQSF